MGKLDPAFGSAPKHSGKYVLYCGKRYTDDVTEVHIFAAAYSAKKWLEVVIQKDGFIHDDTYFRTESGIVIRGERIGEVMTHEYTREEDLWDLPQPYLSQALHFRALATGIIKPKTEVAVTRERERRARAPRASRTGLVTIGQIAEELKTSPRELRGMLRKWKIQKPDCGWAWKDNEAIEMKERLAKELRR